jgi:HEAT repeat protein
MSTPPTIPDKWPAAAPDDLLPPVEPPSAKFLIQLFVVPALIVTVIVCVWLMFGWIVHRSTNRPENLIDGLERSGPVRWQRASELADMLRSQRYAELRRSKPAAVKLASLLDREIEAAATDGGLDSEAINLRYFLCRALGEFDVAAGLDTLAKAATTDHGPEMLHVRRGAIQAIAVRTFNLQSLDPPVDFDVDRVETTLLELASDDEQLIRSEAAFALGRLGTPASIEQLVKMVDDPHADTRYNAAVGLAEHEHLAAVPVLAEMLDPANLTSVQEEPTAKAQRFKRAVIMKNALDGVRKLAATHPGADFAAVTDLLETLVTLSPRELIAARIDPLLIPEAKRALELLNSRTVKLTANVGMRRDATLISRLTTARFQPSRVCSS